MMFIPIISGCTQNQEKDISKNNTICDEQTPLIAIDNGANFFVNFGIYKKVFNKTFPKRDKLEVLKEIAQKKLIVLDADRNGIFNKPEIKKKLLRFKITQLAYRYINRKIGMIKVSDREVNEVIRRFYKNKKVDRNLIVANLKAIKFQESQEKLFKQVLSRIKIRFFSSGKFTARYKNITVTDKDIVPLLSLHASKKQVKNALTFYILYKLAVKDHLDRDPEFEELYNNMLTRIASEYFHSKILKSIKISDRQIKDYFEKHRKKFTSYADAYRQIKLLLFKAAYTREKQKLISSLMKEYRVKFFWNNINTCL